MTKSEIAKEFWQEVLKQVEEQDKSDTYNLCVAAREVIEKWEAGDERN